MHTAATEWSPPVTCCLSTGKDVHQDHGLSSNSKIIIWSDIFREKNININLFLNRTLNCYKLFKNFHHGEGEGGEISPWSQMLPKGSVWKDMQRALAPTTLPQNRKIQGNPCKASDLTLISFAELESPKAGPMPALPSSLRGGFKLIRSAEKGEGEGREGQGHWSRLWTHDGTAMVAACSSCMQTILLLSTPQQALRSPWRWH